MLLQIKNKLGVSLMIGYVLLVSLAVIMGGTMYVWMKSYVPSEGLECPEGASITMNEYFYNCSNLNIINITLENNGRFGIAGYFIKATNNQTQTLATLDLSAKVKQTDRIFKYSAKNAIIIVSGLMGDSNNNSFNPGDEIENSFDLTGIGQIYSIEIIPVRWQDQNNKLRFVSCGEASKYKEQIICS
jgi:hypothetical protein